MKTKNLEKAKKILANLDVKECDPCYKEELENMIAAKKIRSNLGKNRKHDRTKT